MVNMDLLGSSNDEAMEIICPQVHEKGTYSNLSQKFKEKNTDFKKQYCKIYTVRLERMFELLHDRIQWKWGMLIYKICFVIFLF